MGKIREAVGIVAISFAIGGCIGGLVAGYVIVTALGDVVAHFIRSAIS